MMSAAMLGGTLAAILHTAYLAFAIGMQGVEALSAVRIALDTGMGQSLLNAGIPAEIFGSLVQWIVALVSATVFMAAASVFPMMLRQAMVFGPLYGIASFLAGNYALPMIGGMEFAPPPLASQLANIAAHALLMGLPMAWTGKMMMAK